MIFNAIAVGSGRIMAENQRMNTILAMLDRTIAELTPAHMRGDVNAYKRVRMFLMSHLFGPFLGHPITVFLLLNDPQPWPQVHILGLSITAFWLFPIALQFLPRHYSTLALMSVANLTFAILWGSYNYGGASSPFLMWLLVVPLLAFFYLGSGVRTSIAIFTQLFIGIAAFYGAYRMQGGFPEHIPVDSMVGIAMISLACAATYISFMASYYATVVDSQSELLKEIDRHQQTLEQLTVAKDEAERANNAKSEFLAKMSHELRTPLNAVLGYSEILLEDAELDGRGEEIADLQKISAAGKHLLAMVNDILDISKIEAGKTELYLEDIDLAALIDEVESTGRPLAAKNTNAFSINRSGSLGTIHVDATKLRQAIFNLLSNASKFTQNGEITLDVSRYETNDGDEIQISVTDTGVGISDEAQAALFSAFTQANASITAKFGGTGLGLALSKNLCRLMGGDITVRSVLGEGSCFTITLPAIVKAVKDETYDDADDAAGDDDNDALVADAARELKQFHEANAGMSAAQPVAGHTPRRTVLVIDDDRSFLELTERLLNKEGYSPVTTDAPESVLQLARTIRPVAIFVDVLMPQVDGWKVIEMLKGDPATASIPVFMLSILEERHKAKEHKAAGFITKPLDSHKLKEALSGIHAVKAEEAA